MGTPNPDGLLQKLRDFTVQIRHAETDAIVGTGIAVSLDGRVVTCAHVVTDAGADPRTTGGAEVGVYFPAAIGAEVRARRAHVAACFPQHDDDVVVLQLIDGPSPLGPEQIAVLGGAGLSEGHRFRSFGYRRLAYYQAGLADGTIQGPVPPPDGQQVHAEPIQLQSSQINEGMSGAPVLDVERNLVIGLVSETWFPDQSTKDRDTAWAVDARVLTFSPLHLPVQDHPHPRRLAPRPSVDLTTAASTAVQPTGLALDNAPQPLEDGSVAMNSYPTSTGIGPPPPFGRRASSASPGRAKVVWPGVG